MRLNDSDDLSNVEDRRGEEYSGGGGGGGFGGLRLGFGGFVLLAILSLIFGRNFFSMVPRGGGGDSRPVQTTRVSRDTPKARERMAAEEDLRKVPEVAPQRYALIGLHDGNISRSRPSINRRE